jgi:hypothetical protein
MMSRIDRKTEGKVLANWPMRIKSTLLQNKMVYFLWTEMSTIHKMAFQLT